MNNFMKYFFICSKTLVSVLKPKFRSGVPASPKIWVDLGLAAILMLEHCAIINIIFINFHLFEFS